MRAGSKIFPRIPVYMCIRPKCPECGDECRDVLSFDKHGSHDPDEWTEIHHWVCKCGYKRRKPANTRLDPTIEIKRIQ